MRRGSSRSTLTTAANAASFRSRDTVKGELHRRISPPPPFPLRFSVASFSCAAGFPRLETCCSKLELPARKTVVNYNGFPRRDARLPVETFNRSVRKFSKARAILVGGWNGNDEQV